MNSSANKYEGSSINGVVKTIKQYTESHMFTNYDYNKNNWWGERKGERGSLSKV